MTPGTKTGDQGAGCLTIFALPFCGIGLWLACDVVNRLTRGVEDWQQFAMVAMGVLAFGGSGFGLLIWSRIAARKLAEESRLKDQVHIQDIDGVGLITEDVEQGLSPELKTRLEQVRAQR